MRGRGLLQGHNGSLQFFFICSQFASKHGKHRLYIDIDSGAYVIFNLGNLISQCSNSGQYRPVWWVRHLIQLIGLRHLS